MKLKYFILHVLALACTIQAQSLDSLLTVAGQNNQRLQSLLHKRDAMLHRSSGMEYLPPPTVSVEFSQIPVNEINIVDKSISNSIAISQMFPVGGKLQAMAAAEKKGVHAVLYEYKAELRKLNASVTMQYYAAWSIAKKMQVQKELLQIMERSLESLRSRYSSGGLLADIYMAEGLLSSSRQALQSLEHEYDGAVLALKSATGYIGDISFATVVVHEGEEAIPAQNSIQEFPRVNPELLQMQAMENMKLAEHDANNRELIPDLMVQAMFMRMPQGMIVTTGQSMAMLTGMPKTEYMYSLMASVTLPFMPWSKGGIEKKSEALLAEAKQFQFERLDMERVMNTTLQKLLGTYRANKEKAHGLKTVTIPLLHQAEEAAASAFAAGSLSMPQYYEYLKMRTMEEMNYYMAVTDMHMNAAEIHMITASETITEFDRK